MFNLLMKSKYPEILTDDIALEPYLAQDRLFAEIENKWTNTRLKHLSLTSVGNLIAILNWNHKMNETLKIQDFLKFEDNQ